MSGDKDYCINYDSVKYSYSAVSCPTAIINGKQYFINIPNSRDENGYDLIINKSEIVDLIQPIYSNTDILKIPDNVYTWIILRNIKKQIKIYFSPVLSTYEYSSKHSSILLRILQKEKSNFVDLKSSLPDRYCFTRNSCYFNFIDNINKINFLFYLYFIFYFFVIILINIF